MKAFLPYSSKSPNPNTGEQERGFIWRCPGCGQVHSIPTSGAGRGWKWTGTEDRPTFSPSVLCHPHDCLDDDDKPSRTPRCHFFIREGVAHFCGDCEHEHAGEALEVVACPELNS